MIEAVRALERPLLLVLDGIEDPHNLGACLRTADAAGVDGVVVPGGRGVRITATVARVAAGAAESVPLYQVANLARALRALRKEGVWILGTSDQAPQGLYEADLTVPLALVLGREGRGLRRLTAEQCDLLVRIPMHGTVESLNVSVAAGVCLYEALRQREAGEGN
ncbi:MAG: 23S rRNA (guanosine(2251)-2'-O)-methyltransferase RlmB [Gammaproteobacteria bacterium]|nr:MAG: 23S rRNA (guanosine(2251)-2'-O)-methyltransferase RlmB [Gammaproteobacteria bacterium]